MSGDSQRNDDPDFLEDDFVVEDLAGKNDDLEQLFDGPAPPRAKTEGVGVPDADDVLFTDHAAGLQPSEQFQGGKAFAEDAKSEWQGEQLELDSETTKKKGKDADRVAAAKKAFTEDLGALLQGDEDLALDSEKELELVDGPSAADGISEIEQSGPFVLEEGDSAWREGAAAASSDAPAVEPEVAEGIWEAVKEPAMAETADEASTQEPGWEPLPETNVDQLSEVGEVERAEAAAAAAAEPAELAEVEGHDIYSDDQAPVLVGPRAASRRGFGLLTAVAASLAIFGGAAVVVLRPEWVGLQLEPQRVQQVHMERPRVEVAVAAPPAVKVPAPQLGQVTPPPAGSQSGNEPGPMPGTEPFVGPPAPQPGDPVATVPPQPEPHTAPQPETQPEPQPAGQPSPSVVVAPAPTTPVVDWPVAAEPAKPEAGSRQKPPALVRIGDNTMLGEVDGSPGKGQPVEGMAPGTRAFAQLHNGNYFIGSIKVADANRITLRLPEGEVTIASEDLARLTALGSADYEALQKATSGFVRLTNNNKLVGGILSSIADDHIVLEFRSNRVMLPRSAVGAVVQGEAEQEVRLDITREEDDWVRSLVERQLGRGTDAPARPAPKVPPATPANGK